MTEPGARLLIVDDAPATLEVLQRNLSAAGYRVLTASAVGEAIRVLDENPIDLVITDLKMPGASGLELTRHVRDNLRRTEIMIITGYPSIASAVQAVKVGAEEYLAKPFTEDELLVAVERVLKKLDARSAGGPGRRGRFSPYVIGESAPMLPVFEGIAAAAASRAAVLIEGEAGVGKELIARAIHAEGPAASGPFRSLRCHGLGDSLVEEELFGSSAEQGRAGLLGGGSVYLATIEEIGPRLQTRLAGWLRAKQPSAPRLIVSSEEPPSSLAAWGMLRQPLLSRLGPPLRVPPLRQRGRDVALLARHFADQLASQWGRPPLTFDEGALAALCGYAWPGNVAELRALVRRLGVESRDGPVKVVDLPAHLRFRLLGDEAAAERSLEEVEAAHIRNVMVHLQGNKARAAELLGIDRKTLRQKLRRYRLPG